MVDGFWARQTEMALQTLTASDGHQFSCWLTKASGTRRDAVVVLQEIFGVNHHIQAVCERLAAEGFDAYAPALFDRIKPNFSSGYSQDEITKALAFLPQLDWDHLVLDVQATVHHAYQVTPGPVSLMGFCLGASVAYLTSQNGTGIAAVIAYYGGQIVNNLQAPPVVPSLMHFGDADHTITMHDVERIQKERPECTVHGYAAGHGFNCDERPSFNDKCAELAWSRSLQWLAQHATFQPSIHPLPHH